MAGGSAFADRHAHYGLVNPTAVGRQGSSDQGIPGAGPATRGRPLEGDLVTSVADGVQALAVVRWEVPDLVILDVMMPGVDGLGACGVVRAHGLRVPSGCSPPGSSGRGSPGWTPAPTTTWPSRSIWTSCCPACAPCCAGARRNRSAPQQLDLSKTEFDLPDLLGRNAGILLAHPRGDLRPHLGLRLRAGLQEPRGVHQLPASGFGAGRCPALIRTVRGVGYSLDGSAGR